MTRASHAVRNTSGIAAASADAAARMCSGDDIAAVGAGGHEDAPHRLEVVHVLGPVGLVEPVLQARAGDGGRPLRTTPWPYLLVIGLLCGEWIGRRRSGRVERVVGEVDVALCKLLGDRRKTHTAARRTRKSRGLRRRSQRRFDCGRRGKFPRTSLVNVKGLAQRHLRPDQGR